MVGKFEIRESKKLFQKQKYYVVTVGANGEDLQQSEMLSSWAAAETNIEAMRKVLVSSPPVTGKNKKG